MQLALEIQEAEHKEGMKYLPRAPKHGPDPYQEAKARKRKERWRLWKLANIEDQNEKARRRYKLKRLMGGPLFNHRANAATRAWRKRKIAARDLKFRYSELLDAARTRAKEKGLEFNLTIENVSWSTYCPVLGIELDYFARKKRKDSSPSIDRWDNTKGYVVGNTFVISYRANTMKSDGTPDELMQVALYAAKGALR